MKNSIRAFFAIDLTQEANNQVTQIIKELQKKHSHHPIRWSKPHNLHITLQFLAAIKTEHLENLIINVENEIKSFQTFELEIKELELFPTQYHPHIISLKIDPNEKLAELSKSIGQGIVKTGYEIEKRPYRGHLTLARLPRTNKPFTLAEITLPKIEKVAIKEVIFYRSEPSKEGSHYTKLNIIRLPNTP